jgi:aryl-alcohol dehydrogenase-like predicted oxidoreductase
MKYVTIPGTDLLVSAICMGSAEIGGGINHEQSFSLLDTYLELGGCFIDTASVYANWLPVERSISEKTIGRWLRARRNRGKIVLATKGAHPELSSMHVSRMSRAEIVHDLDASLQNLQTETIDLYWLHRDSVDRPVEEIVDVLVDQVQAGKIRYFGCSNWHAPRIRAAQAYAVARGVRGFVADQMMWSLAAVNPDAIADKTIAWMDDELMAYHRASGLAAIPFSSQAHGLFQKMARQPRPEIPRVYRVEENERRFARVQRLAAQSGLSVTQIALGYLRAQPFTTIPIVGCRTIEQLRDSMSASDVVLDDSQIRYLEGGE